MTLSLLPLSGIVVGALSVGCPADAVKEVKEIADFIATNKGGDGAVRDFIEFIIKNNTVYAPI